MIVVACGGQVMTHQQLQVRIERWVAARGLSAAEEVHSRLCQGLADSNCSAGAPADSQGKPAAGFAATADASATDAPALSKQVQEVRPDWHTLLKQSSSDLQLANV